MTNTPFSKRCEILSHANDELLEIPQFADIVIEYDLGFAYAHGIVYDHITINDGATHFIDEAWEALCNLFGVDSDADYDSLEEVLAIANE